MFWFKHKLEKYLSIFCLILFILTITPFLGNYHNLLDLTSHFRLYYFFFSVILFVNLIVFRFKIKNLLIITLLCLFINTYEISFLFKDNTFTNNKGYLKILHANLLSSNSNKNKIFKIISDSSPDIIAFQEVNSEWVNKINLKLKGYPYQKVISRPDNFGIAIFSKKPWIRLDIKYFNEFKIPSLVVKFDKFNLVYTHPVPPISNQYFKIRNNHFDKLSNYINSLENCILFGDLNISPWSNSFKKLKYDSDLIHSSNRLIATWPTPIPFLPIDHFLHSKNIKVKKVKLLNEFGSDHLPVLAEFNL